MIRILLKVSSKIYTSKVLRSRLKCFFLHSEMQKNDGAYAVQDNQGDKVLFLFEEEDDAERYAMHA